VPRWLKGFRHPEDRDVDRTVSRALLAKMRHGTALSCWMYGAGLLLLIPAEGGTRAGWPTVVVAAFALLSLITGAICWVRARPGAATSMGLLMIGEVAHTGVLLTLESGLLALIATTWLVMHGSWLTILHSRPAIAAHASWSALNVLGFGVAALNRDNSDPVLIGLIMATLIVLLSVTPPLRQLGADALRDDSRRATELAERDSLTGLMNYRGMHSAVSQLLAGGDETADQMVAVVLDIDSFKDINDSHGHHVGDRVLVSVAGQLNRRLRRGAIAARTGGDEFVILDTVAHSAGSDVAGELGERVLTAALAAGHSLEGASNGSAGSHVNGNREASRSLSVNGSVGVAVAPISGLAVTDPRRDIEQLIKQADQAMYVAKRHGGRCVRVYDKAL
jgi:diguanylate cyclase (GGDEF)-like protein